MDINNLWYNTKGSRCKIHLSICSCFNCRKGLIFQMNLSDDSIAILLLCSDLTTRNTQSEYRPYTVSQWNKLTEKLITLQKTPKDLFNIDVLAENLNNLLI